MVLRMSSAEVGSALCGAIAQGTLEVRGVYSVAVIPGKTPEHLSGLLQRYGVSNDDGTYQVEGCGDLTVITRQPGGRS